MTEILDEIPFGYRWATDEDMQWIADKPDWFVEVKKHGILPGLAIKWDCFIEFGDHNHDPEECERVLYDMKYASITDDRFNEVDEFGCESWID